MPLSEIKVALVNGGPHPYYASWPDAAAQAKKDFGLADVTFDDTSEWDQTKQNALLDSLAARGYNAFAVFGVSPADINSTFEHLRDEGFAVGSVTSCPAGDKDSAYFCLSTDVEQAAYEATKALIDTLGGEGSIVHVTGLLVDSNTQRRIEGVEKAVAESNGKIKLVQHISDIDNDLQTAEKAVTDLLVSRGSEVDGIVGTSTVSAEGAIAAVKKANLPIKIMAIDDTEPILDGIRDGSVAGTMVQNPWGQAYVGAYVVAKLQSGQCTINEDGIYVDSGSFLVGKDNVDTFDAKRIEKSKSLIDDFNNKYLTCKG